MACSKGLTDDERRTVAAATCYKVKYADKEYGRNALVNVRDLGTDPSNRKGARMQLARVRSLGETILSVGTDPDEPHGGCVVRYKHDDDTLRDFNRKMTAGDKGWGLVEQRMMFGTLEHSHYIQWARCCSYEVECEVEHISNSGRISLERLEQYDNNMYMHATCGVRVDPLTPEVLNEKNACVVISKASNLKQKIGMNETEVEVLSTLEGLCLNSIRLGHKVARESLLQSAMKTLPCELPDLAGFLDFAAAFLVQSDATNFPKPTIAFAEVLRCVP
jgi:hypothetical protein